MYLNIYVFKYHITLISCDDWSSKMLAEAYFSDEENVSHVGRPGIRVKASIPALDAIVTLSVLSRTDAFSLFGRQTLSQLGTLEVSGILAACFTL